MKHNAQVHLWAFWGALCLGLLHNGAHAQTATQMAAQVEAGFQVILDRQQGNCLTCHALNTTKLPKLSPKDLGLQGNFGPPLDGVGARYDKVTLLQWVTDARQIKPDTLMPPYGSIEGLNLANALRPLLTPEQRQAVAAALSTLH